MSFINPAIFKSYLITAF